MDAPGEPPPPTPTQSRGLERLAAVGVALACLAVLVTAARLAPDAAGHGTHERLGLPPCAWAQTFDKPCVTCGMTTAFAHAAHGDVLDSARTQPAGFVLAVLTAAVAWGAAHVAVTGSSIWRVTERVLTTRVLWVSVGLLLASWAYKFVIWEG